MKFVQKLQRQQRDSCRKNIYIKNVRVQKTLENLEKTGFNFSAWVERRFLEDFGKQDIETLKQVFREELRAFQERKEQDLKRLSEYYDAQIAAMGKKAQEQIAYVESQQKEVVQDEIR
ncbi:hypothetical protein HY485_02415 [Candidatus Woesearchaeota archaeon]|nr:hypothetical protein [Candidatus Woesearchaeota archaeon]